MIEQRNNAVYNHPQTEDEINQQVNLSNHSADTAEQKVAVNPNPRANENLKDKNISADENVGAGSEITDGEDG